MVQMNAIRKLLDWSYLLRTKVKPVEILQVRGCVSHLDFAIVTMVDLVIDLLLLFLTITDLLI